MSMESDLAAIPQFIRGKVWCRTCGAEQSVNVVDAVFRDGWPKCCGHTMTIDSPEEQKAFDRMNQE